MSDLRLKSDQAGCLNGSQNVFVNFRILSKKKKGQGKKTDFLVNILLFPLNLPFFISNLVFEFRLFSSSVRDLLLVRTLQNVQ